MFPFNDTPCIAKDHLLVAMPANQSTLPSTISTSLLERSGAGTWTLGHFLVCTQILELALAVSGEAR